MPDGYRRGGVYTRGGKTFHRSGARIGTPVKVALGVGALGLVALAPMAGDGVLVAHPVLFAGLVGVCVLVGTSPYTSRRVGGWALRRGRVLGRRVETAAKKRRQTRLKRARVPAMKAETHPPKTGHQGALAAVPAPESWRSGGEPATGAQRAYLERCGHNPAGLTKADASRRIERIRRDGASRR